MFQHQGLDHIAISVRDLDRSARWYIDLFGFERRFEKEWKNRPVFIAKGETGIALFSAKTDPGPGSSSPDLIRLLHFAWRTDWKNFLAAQKELKERGIEFEFQDHEVSHSIYFSDPDGHKVEITTYDLESQPK